MEKVKSKYKSVLAVTDDGTVQLTITIPKESVEAVREESLSHLISTLEVSGFRKGKVPREIALKHINTQDLTQHMLSHLLPAAYVDAIKEHSIRPVLSPRFELISTESDWTVRATTCQLPEVKLEDYKQMVKGVSRRKEIWVPGKEDDKGKENGSRGGPGREEVMDEIIKLILEKANVRIPRLLIEEEVNHRLSRLLDQVQKLGLTVEQYLSSTGKSSEDLKGEYAKEAENTIKIELSLNKIAERENLIVGDEEVDSVLAAADNAVGKKNGTPSDPQQKQYIRAAILRRKALDRLVSFA